MNEEYCAGCHHPISRHYYDVNGVVRCMIVEHGVSTGGICGMPHSIECDCENYISKYKIEQRKRVAEQVKSIAEQEMEFIIKRCFNDK